MRNENWTPEDQASLVAAAARYPSRAAAAEALRLETYTLTRYLGSDTNPEPTRQPRGKLAILSLRERIKRELGRGKKSTLAFREKAAGPEKSTR